jgi:hypothetical protein
MFPIFGLLHPELSGSPASTDGSSFRATKKISHWNIHKAGTYVQSRNYGAARVTRLGEFSPIGRLFSLASLLKSKEEGQILEVLFSTVPY